MVPGSCSSPLSAAPVPTGVRAAPVEGRCSPLGRRGHSRDGTKGNQQTVSGRLGLLATHTRNAVQVRDTELPFQQFTVRTDRQRRAFAAGR